MVQKYTERSTRKHLEEIRDRVAGNNALDAFLDDMIAILVVYALDDMSLELLHNADLLRQAQHLITE